MGDMMRRRVMMSGKSGAKNRIYLFDNGDPCEDVTGGWEFNKFFAVQTARFSAENDGQFLTIDAIAQMGSASAKTISTYNPIDLTSFTKMVFTGEFSRPNGSGNYWMYFPLNKSNATTNQSTAFGSNYSSRRVNVGNMLGNGAGIVTTEIDISGYNDAPYICLNLNLWNNAPIGCYGRALSVYLE